MVAQINRDIAERQVLHRARNFDNDGRVVFQGQQKAWIHGLVSRLYRSRRLEGPIVDRTGQLGIVAIDSHLDIDFDVLCV